MLHRVADEAKVATSLGVAPRQLAATFDRALPTLRAIRAARPAPAVDDSMLPSGSSAATLLFLELGELTGDPAFVEAAARVLRGASKRLTSDPFSSGFLLVAADHASSEVREAVIARAAEDPRTRALLRELAQQSDARVLVARVPAAGAPEALIKGFPALEGKKAIGDKPTAFLCKRGACEAPTSDPAVLR